MAIFSKNLVCKPHKQAIKFSLSDSSKGHSIGHAPGECVPRDVWVVGHQVVEGGGGGEAQPAAGHVQVDM